MLLAPTEKAACTPADEGAPRGAGTPTDAGILVQHPWMQASGRMVVQHQRQTSGSQFVVSAQDWMLVEHVALVSMTAVTASFLTVAGTALVGFPPWHGADPFWPMSFPVHLRLGTLIFGVKVKTDVPFGVICLVASENTKEKPGQVYWKCF